jgi:hypothetical protein
MYSNEDIMKRVLLPSAIFACEILVDLTFKVVLKLTCIVIITYTEHSFTDNCAFCLRIYY